MFLHVDESGNSGNNLFDPNQPVLSYGVLSSRWDVDTHGTEEREAILRQLGADALHANQLGDVGLNMIADALANLHYTFDFRFDYYFIHKRSFAVVTLFNAVFDAGINTAMKWDWYWTPLRFPLIAVLDHILDDNLLSESWRLCLVPNNRIDRERDSIVALLSNILARLEASDVDVRFREILRDALRFGIQNPLGMDFGIYSPTALSPNTIGFQFVLTAIAYRQKVHRQKALGITVDRQTQFNAAQVNEYEMQSKLAAALRGDIAGRGTYLAHPFLAGVREDTATLISHFPEEHVTISPSDQSFGLQVTDTYLWLVNRYIKGRDVPLRLAPILESVFSQGMIDGISISAMIQRWKAFEQGLPSFANVTPEQQAQTLDSIDKHREKVKSLELD
jgi:hypothetical protein